MQIVDPYNEDAGTASRELIRAFEVISQVKLGWNNRWCPQGGPPRVCCALQHRRYETPGPKIPGMQLDKKAFVRRCLQQYIPL